MKNYKVYFIIENNGHGYLNEQDVSADSQKVAIQKVKDSVLKNAGKNAFSCSTKPPKMTKSGMSYNGAVYAGYSELFHMLY